jgi:hypothetical protein
VWVVDSSDDEFMMMDWTNIWYDEFKAAIPELHLLIAPNSEHSLATGIPEVVESLNAFVVRDGCCARLALFLPRTRHPPPHVFCTCHLATCHLVTCLGHLALADASNRCPCCTWYFILMHHATLPFHLTLGNHPI